MKPEIVRKLTSRKLWMAIAAFATGIIFALRKDAATAETVSGLIMSLASVVAYIFGEGLTDAAYVNADPKNSQGVNSPEVEAKIDE